MSESDGDAGATPARPVLRVVSGSPTPEELAVLTALVAASGGGDEPAPRVRRGGWSDPSLGFRRAATPGPNGWRAALQPR